MYTTNKPVKRPVWKNHEIIGYVTISLEDKDVGRRIEGEANSELFFRHLSH